MKTFLEPNNLLSRLKLAIFSPGYSREEVLAALEDILLWLNKPENNNDENCKTIDYYVCIEIMPEKKIEELPDDIQNVLFDMGAQLHDTHTSPKIAENFDSTPSQLLERVRKLTRR